MRIEYAVVHVIVQREEDANLLYIYIYIYICIRLLLAAADDAETITLQ